MNSGFYLINKPCNITSSNLVLSIKKKLSLKKIGHTGTLDKFANGLMILPFGECTAFSEIFLHSDKEYITEVEFGKSTDSGDIDGNILEEWSEESRTKFFLENRDLIKTEILNIKNINSQIPPKISALKIGGKRQSVLFRQNISFEEKIRQIKIYDLEFDSLNETGFHFKVNVSSGTYIRKLVMDLSEKLKFPMFVKNLKRTKIQKFHLHDSHTPEEIYVNPNSFFSLEKILDFPIIKTTERIKILNGVTIPFPKIPKEFLILDEKNFLLAWCEESSGKLYKYKKVFQGITNIPFQPTSQK